MQAILVGWRIYDLLQDPLALGLVGLAEAVPAISLALIAGHIVDRSRPLIIYRRVIAVSFVSALVVLISQVFAVHFGLWPQVITLYLASVLTGVARAFSQPAVYATVPRIVERTRLHTASAWMSSAMQVARIAGPALGGIFFGWMGVVFTAGVTSATLLGGILTMCFLENIQMGPIPKKQDDVKESFFSGASFVFSHPILFPALSLDMISVLFGGVTALLPIFAKEILLVGPKGLGMLRAAPAAGAAVMSFFLTRFYFKKNAGHWLFMAVAGFGVCILVFGLSTDFYISLAALFLSGLFDSVSMVIRTSAVQLVSPDHMRGRISAVNSIFIGSSNEIGEFESGIAAKLLGTVPAVIFGGAMCLLTVAIMAWKAPTLRKMDLEKI